MRNILKIIGNSALVIGGFFIILIASSKASHQSDGFVLKPELAGGVAHAEAAGDSGGSGDCGSSDSGGCGGGK
jgi:hypothetical protein